jgi:hypothetical protein
MEYVYRYEHAYTGCGPYQSDKQHTEAAAELCERINRAHSAKWIGNKRIPSKRPSLYPGDSRALCGVTSMGGLRRWFWGFNQDLRKAGFTIRRYPAKIVRRCETFKGQVSFLKEGVEW